jgi:hypothetical protein
MRRFILVVVVLLGTTSAARAGEWRNSGATCPFPGASHEFRVDVYVTVGGIPAFVDTLPFTGPIATQYPGYYNWTIGPTIVDAPGATGVVGYIKRRPTGGEWVHHNGSGSDMTWNWVP